MTRPPTEKLFVNLSASQARKRLKKHGWGVRRVESAGRNQSVIHHTATGQHLRELESLLADVAISCSQPALGVPLENLMNLGPTSAGWLREVGVQTRTDLERLGPALAFRLVKERRPGTSINMLWALAGALAERDWRRLSDVEKDELRTEVERSQET